MSNGIAKSAPVKEVATEPIKVSSEEAPLSSTVLWEGVPIEVFRYFNQDLGSLDKNVLSKLKYIHEFSKESSSDKSLIGVLKSIKDVESKLGAPSFGETRFDRIFNWMKISKSIRHLEEQRNILRKAG